MFYRTKTCNVAAYGGFYTSPGVHMYAVSACPRDINKRCAEACAMILNNNGHIIKEERQLLDYGYIKVTFTYEIF